MASYEYISIETPEDRSSAQKSANNGISQKKKSFPVAYFVVLAVFIVVSVLVVVSSGNMYKKTSINPSRTMTTTKLDTLKTFKLPGDDAIYLTSDELTVTAFNEYGRFEGPYPWMDDVKGTQLIEPYRSTTLTVSGTSAQDGHSYVWVIEGQTIDYQGTTFDITIPEVGKYALEVHVFDADDIYLGTFSTRLICKYVKREIRTLTDADREAVFDAMATVWQYSQEEGKATFGDKFTSIDTYVTIHSEASNDVMCDQYHEGSGFLTHHLAMAVSFEAAIRAVNPAVTLPYWDFTIEGETIEKAGQVPSFLLQISEMFTDKYVGSVDENNHIADGRWAHALMPVALDAQTTQNSYGYIRSYWNNNPDPEISRSLFNACGSEPYHKKIPSCATHFDILNSKNLGILQLLTPGDGHGPMHVQSGGVWGGCTDAYAKFLEKWGDVLEADMSEDEITQHGFESALFMNKWGSGYQRKTMVEKSIIGEYFHIYRSLWRSHMCAVDNSPTLLVCPESCDVETTPFEECTCTVPKLVSGETEWQNLFPCVLNSASNQDFFNKTMPQEMLEDLVRFIATSSVLEGEMIESASTADPLFWLIHPVIERLVSAKRISTVSTMGSKTFSKWDSLSESDWLEYSYYNLPAGGNKYHPEQYTCAGHKSTDPALPGGYSLPYTSAIEAIADTDGDGTISNWEFLVAIDPNNMDGNDYVFDNFEWSHCS